ncbi:MAG TPA: glycosyltransferase [Myxococcota bacterium]
MAFVPQGETAFVDVKLVEGLSLYASLWPGTVRCLMRTCRREEIFFGRDYALADLPFTVVPIEADARSSAKHLSDVALVLASGDNFRDLQIGDVTDAAVVFVIEYALETRLQILRLDARGGVPKPKALLWQLLTERARRRAFRRAAGLQANGAPAYDAYGALTPASLLYFDTRLRSAQQASGDDVAAKLLRAASGAPLRLAFSGRLEPMKGADHLLLVARALYQRRVPFTLSIYGDGSLRDPIARAIEAEGMSSRVFLRGSVPFDDVLVPTMKSEVDVFLCCHRQSDPSCTYLETIGCGVPIVGYNNRAFAGVLRLGNVGAGVPIDDVDGCADAIAELHHDRRRLARMIERAAAIGRKHSFEREFAERVDHLRAVAGV